jgi:hypothetical protein
VPARATYPALALLLAAAVVAGCAEGGTVGDNTTPAGPATTSGSAPPEGAATAPSATDLPTLQPPKGPPKTPTDNLPRDRIAGRITKGGSGPCYGLVTDDGKEYALHSTAGLELEEGTYVRARIATLRLKIYCGPGQHVALLEAEKV